MNEISEVICEVQFETRVPHGTQRVRSVQATLQAVHNKLLERALHDDPSQVDGNLRCASTWLKGAADELDRLLADRARTI